MRYDFFKRCFRYSTDVVIIQKKIKISDLNYYLLSHDINDFIKYIKQNNMFHCNDGNIDFSIITLYNVLRFEQHHYNQMLKILKQKYFYKLHQLLPYIKSDFPLYSEYVQLMFEYMLDNQIKLSDCVSQIAGFKESFYTSFNYDLFIDFVKNMLIYCENEKLKNNIIKNVIDRILRIKNKEQKQLPMPTCQLLNQNCQFDIHSFV